MLIQTAQFIGLTEDHAITTAGKLAIVPRIVKRNQENFMLTEDHRHDRINFTIENGKVTNAIIG